MNHLSSILFLSYLCFNLSLHANQNLLNKLDICPDKPNCAITIKKLANRESQFIAPLSIKSKSLEEVRTNLQTLLKADDQFIIYQFKDQYVQTTYTSSLFKFIDDVQFVLLEDDTNNQILIHARSSSRVGFYDFDANKKRIKRIFSQLENSFR